VEDVPHILRELEGVFKHWAEPLTINTICCN
jgi:hypothetical protein